MRTPKKRPRKTTATTTTGEDRIRYVGRQPSVVVFGRRFHRGRWTTVRTLEPGALDLLLANPQFERPPPIRPRSHPAPATDQENDSCPPAET